MLHFLRNIFTTILFWFSWFLYIFYVICRVWITGNSVLWNHVDGNIYKEEAHRRNVLERLGIRLIAEWWDDGFQTQMRVISQLMCIICHEFGLWNEDQHSTQAEENKGQVWKEHASHLQITIKSFLFLYKSGILFASIMVKLLYSLNLCLRKTIYSSKFWSVRTSFRKSSVLCSAVHQLQYIIEMKIFMNQIELHITDFSISFDTFLANFQELHKTKPLKFSLQFKSKQPWTICRN